MQHVSHTLVATWHGCKVTKCKHNLHTQYCFSDWATQYIIMQIGWSNWPLHPWMNISSSLRAWEQTWYGNLSACTRQKIRFLSGSWTALIQKIFTYLCKNKAARFVSNLANLIPSLFSTWTTNYEGERLVMWEASQLKRTFVAKQKFHGPLTNSWSNIYCILHWSTLAKYIALPVQKLL